MSTIFAALNNTLLAGGGILRKYDSSTKRWSIKTSVTRAERDAIEGKHVGLRIVNTTSGQIEYWTGGNWADGAATSGAITVSPSSTTITGVRVGNPVTATQTASGGTAPYTWAVVSGSLPPGYALSTGGSWSGTVSLPGTFTATIRATDASGRTGEATYTWVITVADSAALTLVVSPPSQIIENVPTGQIVAGSQITTGGTAPYVWTVSAGSSPPGYALSTAGVWSGTVTTPGTYTATVRVTDDVGAIGEATYTWIIVGTAVDVGLSVLTSSVNFYQGTPSTDILTASGGTEPYSWSITDGALPDGISLHVSTGTLMGTPTTPGDYDFVATVTDADEETATRSFSGTVGAPGAVDILPAITKLPAAVSGQSYASGLTGIGGTPPYTWAITSGALPTGYFLHAVNGVIYSGSSAIASATYSFTATATDSLGATGSRAYQIDAVGVPAITVQAPPAGAGGVNRVMWDGAQFVAVGQDRVSPYHGFSLLSADGTTWSRYETGLGAIRMVGIAYSGSLYVAVSSESSSIHTSPDAQTWTARSTSVAQWGWSDVAYGAGVFVATHAGGFGREGIWTSADGITWTSRGETGYWWRRVIYAGGKFVASGDNGVVATSSDGITWTHRTTVHTGQNWALGYGNGIYVYLGTGSAARLSTSADGITWTERTLPYVGNYLDVAYGAGTYYAVGLAGGVDLFSLDGVSWGHVELPSGSGIVRRAVAYGNSKFVIFGQDVYNGAYTDLLLTSP